MLNFLRKAARFAQHAKTVIDGVQRHLDKNGGPGGSVTGAASETSATASAGKQPPPNRGADPAVSSSYRAMMDAGARDGRELLGREDAASILGTPVREAALTGQEEYLQCEYYAEDGSGTNLGIGVSALMPWDYLDTELSKDETMDGLGDQAFRSGDTIYVNAGESIFWITRGGAATDVHSRQAAELVMARLR